MKLGVFFIFLTMFSSSFALEEKSCVHDKDIFRCVEFIYNYDADTITFDLPGVHPLFGKRAKIRVLGVDTPELRSKDPCEKKKAIFAKKLVNQKLKIAKYIELRNATRGKYFRIVAEVYLDGQSLSKFLLDKKLAYPYYGGTKPLTNWCDDLTPLALPDSKPINPEQTSTQDHNPRKVPQVDPHSKPQL